MESKLLKLLQAESRMMVTRGQGKVNGGDVDQGVQILSYAR